MRHLILCAVLVATSAGAQVPRLEFKGVPFGATQDELRSAILTGMKWFDCSPEDAAGLSTCTIKGPTFAEKETHSIYARFRNGGLAFVMVNFDSDGFFDVVAAITEKYGKPARTQKSPYRTKGGTTHEQVEITWRVGTSGAIQASRFMKDITSASVYIGTTDEIARINSDQAGRPARAKKDI